MTTTRPLPRVLCVDDDWNLLSGLDRALRSQFAVKTTPTPADALTILAADPSFAVIVSDLKMPGMHGTKFLERARQLAPDAVRVLFTGQADLNDAAAAVNEGQIFRLILKPCPSALIIKTLLAAAEQHRLMAADRSLLQDMLRESVNAIVAALSLSQPVAVERALRIRCYAAELAERATADERWQIEIAAMLSQLGGIGIPAESLDRAHKGGGVSPAEQAQVDAIPATAARIIGSIPRLDPLREILLHVHARYDGSGPQRFAVAGAKIPLGARMLKVAIDYDGQIARGESCSRAIDTLQQRQSWYDPGLLAAFLARRRADAAATSGGVLELRLDEVRVGMVFAEDVISPAGVLLVPSQQEVTAALVDRVQAQWRTFAATLVVRVVVGADAAEPAGAAT